jgi:hypothetical protein
MHEMSISQALLDMAVDRPERPAVRFYQQINL